MLRKNINIINVQLFLRLAGAVQVGLGLRKHALLLPINSRVNHAVGNRFGNNEFGLLV